MTDATAEPRRVLWLIKGLGPGGAENLLAASSEVVDRSHFRYAVAYFRHDKNHLVPRLASHGVPAHLVTEGRWGRFRWPLRLRKLMSRADIVHVHSPLVAGAVRLLSMTIRPTRRPVLVSTEHNEWSSFAAPTRLLNALTSGLDHHRFAVSDRVRSSMWPRQQRTAEVLIHGIVLSSRRREGSSSSSEMRSELGLPAQSVVGIIVANYRRDKDYPNVLHAARSVVDRARDFHLLVVGQGPLHDEVTALHTRLGLEGNVHLLGYRQDVPALLTAADMFILGSAHEGLPVAVMEAMAAGLPIVATDVGGVAEVVPSGVCGLIVPPGSSSALAAAILALMEDPQLRRRMADSSHERSTAFDITTAVRREEEVYSELAGRRDERRGVFARRS